MRTDWEHLRMVSASAISPVLAYYTPTKGFLLALVLAFAFNIYAGMKDEQALKIQDLKFELSQERQNSLINERFNRLGNCGCGGNSCGCGCGQ